MKDGIFGCPQGEVTTEVPDGVTRAYDDGTVRTNLLSADFVVGGWDGHAYGSFYQDTGQGFPVAADRPSDRFRVK